MSVKVPSPGFSSLQYPSAGWQKAANYLKERENSLASKVDDSLTELTGPAIIPY